MNIGMARLARKQMADMRALEEQAERVNVLEGSGATPSMGLSQFRGGKKHASDASAQGKALAEHLHSLHGSGYARDFHSGMAMAGGLGTGRYEGEGKMHGGFWGALATLAAPLLGKLLGQGKISKEAHDRIVEEMKNTKMGHLEKLQLQRMLEDPEFLKEAEEHEEKQKTKGSKKSKKKAAAEAEAAQSMMQMSKDRTMDAAQSLAQMKGKGKMKGCGSMQRMVGAGDLEIEVKHMEGAGPISNLGIPIISNIAGLFGLGKDGKKQKAKREVGAADGRRKRAEVVRRVMKEKGMKMIEASKYVKEHNLY